MTMDAQIIAALIGGVATIAAAVIAWWLHEKKSHASLSGGSKIAVPDSKNSPPNIINNIKSDAELSRHQLIENPAINLSKITVKEIVESINVAPPFQKEQISKQYNGIKVNWIGYLRDVMEDPRDKECARVNLTINQDTFIGDSFWFSEKIVNFPEIRTLKRGSAVRVVGVILSASGDGLCVDLKPMAIEVLEDHA